MDGYIGEPGQAGSEHLIRMLPDQQSLFNAIEGGNVCFPASAGVVIGASTAVCLNKTFVSTWSIGVQFSLAGLLNVSGTLPLDFDGSRGWNGAIEDRLRGTMRQDLLTLPEKIGN